MPQTIGKAKLFRSPYAVLVHSNHKRLWYASSGFRAELFEELLFGMRGGGEIAGKAVVDIELLLLVVDDGVDHENALLFVDVEL